MHHLPKEIEEAFRYGDFVVKDSSGKFHQGITRWNKQISYESGRPVDLIAILRHELCANPVALSELNDGMRSGDKAVLIKMVTDRITCPTAIEVTCNSRLIIEGQATSARTFDDLTDVVKTGKTSSLLQKIKPSFHLFCHATLQEQAFDYLEVVIADGSQDNIDVISMIGTNVPGLRPNHEEADMSASLHAASFCMLLPARKRILSQEQWILTLFFSWLITTIGFSLSESLPTSQKHNLIGFHTLTGSDVTSCVATITKRATWTIYTAHCKILNRFGAVPLTTNQVSSTEHFITKLYKVCDHSSTCDAAEYAVHYKVSTFEINLRKKSLPMPAYTSTGTQSDMRPETLVTIDGKKFHIITSNKNTDEGKMLVTCVDAIVAIRRATAGDVICVFWRQTWSSSPSVRRRHGNCLPESRGSALCPPAVRRRESGWLVAASCSSTVSSLHTSGVYSTDARLVVTWCVVQSSCSLPTIGGRQEIVRLITCGDAEGHFLPPVIIIKGVYKKKEFERGLSPGSQVFMNQKSLYVNGDIFLQWLNRTLPTPHITWKRSFDFRWPCSHCNTFEMHTTQALQPLDKSFFGPIKVYFIEAVNFWVMQNQKKGPSRGMNLVYCWGKHGKDQRLYRQSKTRVINDQNDISSSVVSLEPSTSANSLVYPSPAILTSPSMSVDVVSLPASPEFHPNADHSCSSWAIKDPLTNQTAPPVRTTGALVRPIHTDTQETTSQLSQDIKDSNCSEDELEQFSSTEGMCAECFELYYNTTSAADWIKCVNCNKWLHETCTMYITDLNELTVIAACRMLSLQYALVPLLPGKLITLLRRRQIWGNKQHVESARESTSCRLQAPDWEGYFAVFWIRCLSSVFKACLHSTVPVDVSEFQRNNFGQKFSFPNASTWDTCCLGNSSVTSEGHVRQSAHPCSKRQIEFWIRKFRRFEMNFISISSPVLNYNGATVFCVDLRSDRGSSRLSALDITAGNMASEVFAALTLRQQDVQRWGCSVRRHASSLQPTASWTSIMPKTLVASIALMPGRHCTVAAKDLRTFNTETVRPFNRYRPPRGKDGEASGGSTGIFVFLSSAGRLRRSLEALARSDCDTVCQFTSHCFTGFFLQGHHYLGPGNVINGAELENEH
ncbi:hypothetical protein PR048_031869 [Dryococelus australis]|uniref:Uncharacterized protein n=1 Tax=Dryococelus australis TaxID=614101 RepID=A0ABQ9G6H5_9NEOP|nr:hypothetical protein PR048_031869 [Dryococelus australis]